jgi:dextranase
VYQLLNFRGVVDNAWRDTFGTQPKPTALSNITVTIKDTAAVKSVWMASPDRANGAPSSLSFTQLNGNVQVTLPSLAYWDQLVLQH